MENKEKKYNYVYKITNLINGKYYIGIHSTNNIRDNYRGSGKLLLKAYKKYGNENFNKEFLFFVKTKIELLKVEEELVNKEFVIRNDNYNLALGGGKYTDNLVMVKDINGNKLTVNVKDPRFLSGELICVHKGKVIVKDKNGKQIKVFKTDERILTGELEIVKRYNGKLCVKNKVGKILFVEKTDPRYLSGELVA